LPETNWHEGWQVPATQAHVSYFAVMTKGRQS